MNLIPLLAFGSLGPQEMILIFLVLLLLFGAKKLPELARGIGKSAGEFKRARDEFEREIKTAETDATKPAAPAAAASSHSPATPAPTTPAPSAVSTPENPGHTA